MINFIKNNIWPTLGLFLVILFVAAIIYSGKTKKFCGKVVDKYIIPPGYREYTERHIIFYNDSLHKNLDVTVSKGDYANIYINDNVCLNLTLQDINN